MVQRIGLSEVGPDENDASFQGLGTNPDARVAAVTPAGEALLRAIVETVAEVEVTEAWENSHFDKTPLGAGEPPEWQQADGSKMTSAQMRSGLHPGWMWMSDWQVMHT